MFKVLVMPETRRGPLSCVWIETGNPQQPLAQVWIDRQVRIASGSSGNQETAQPCCA